MNSAITHDVITVALPFLAIFAGTLFNNRAIARLEAEVKDTRATLESQIKDTRSTLESQIKDTRSTLESQIKDTRSTLESQIKDTRSTLEFQIKDVRSEARADRNSIREEIRDLRIAMDKRFDRVDDHLTRLHSVTGKHEGRLQALERQA